MPKPFPKPPPPDAARKRAFWGRGAARRAGSGLSAEEMAALVRVYRGPVTKLPAGYARGYRPLWAARPEGPW